MKKVFNKITDKADMLHLPDCSSLNERGFCSFLKAPCSGESCSFFHSNETEEFALIKWQKRLSSLNDEEQIKISNKYYGGLMQWK